MVATAAVSTPKTTMPRAWFCQPVITFTAWPASTAPVEAKPKYIRIARTNGITAP